MPIRSGRELRAAFLEYFRTHARFPHPVVPSAPLIPPDDPTLLFTSAGMVQFKPLYSGAIDPLPYVRAVSCQKCLRAGGKGSDLENVGKTLRHHTLFEMLGNFSFGDYFKAESIQFAWEFCTSPHWMALPKERLFPTVYGPTPEELDREAEAAWLDCGAVNRPVPLDAKENFWGPAGDTGACGPCSEVKYFMGSEAELAEVRRLLASGDAGMAKVAQRIIDEGDLFLEIWNMVFPQYDQQKDGSRPPLANRGIDTGAGLERMTLALASSQGTKLLSQYETDLLAPITKAAASAIGVDYDAVVRAIQSGAGTDDHRRQLLASNAIADHVRAMTFCLAEGLTPSNIGRGYVVRRIARRALRFASLQGVDRPFMAEVYPAVAETLGDIYPEIRKNPKFIREALTQEEETFLRTLTRGQRILDEVLDGARNGSKTVAAEDIFRLWDTYGFPADLTREIAEDAGLAVDMAGYEAERLRQKAESKKTWKGATMGVGAELVDDVAEEHGATAFVGYSWRPGATEARVLAIVKDGARVARLDEGEEGLVVLDRTPFYAESGGQTGDTGTIETATARLAVLDTQKTPQGVYLHRVRSERGGVFPGDGAVATVDLPRRQAIMRNHTATHLLQNALKATLGEHITQAGSFCGPDYLRFDFTHTEPVDAAAQRTLQDKVNALILADHPVVTEVLTIEEARLKGAIAPFGEKYGAIVRVVQAGPSIEFCGGTHLERTSQAGAFRIVSESSIASGVRRIEAVTGAGAADAAASAQYDTLIPLQQMLAAKGPEVVERVKALSERTRELEKEVAALRRELAMKEIGDPEARAVALEGGARMVALRLDGFDGNELRSVTEAVRQKLGDGGVAIAAGVKDGKVSLVVACGKDAAKRYPAGKLVNALATPLGGKGGGKPELAQAGAKDAGPLDETLARAAELAAAL
jgi:alanyl-tRNA synthetase